jgi:hypothetical protein
MYVKNTNGQPETYSIGQLRRDNPNTSFPKRPSDELLAGWGIYPLTPTPQPEYDTIHEYLESSFDIQGDKAVQVWTPTRRETIPEVDQVAADQIRQIKTDAGDIILARYPFHKQINYTARGTELLRNRNERPLTPEELEEQKFLEGILGWINAQRAETDRLEALVKSVVDGDLTDDQKRSIICKVKFVRID